MDRAAEERSEMDCHVIYMRGDSGFLSHVTERTRRHGANHL